MGILNVKAALYAMAVMCLYLGLPTSLIAHARSLDTDAHGTLRVFHGNRTQAHATDHKPAAGNASHMGDRTHVELPAVTLIDHNGQAQPLRGSMTAEQTIVIDFVYTSCKTICPVLTGILMKLHDQIEACPGTNVAFLSITVDPAIDTPARLNEHVRKAQSPWFWLTGPAPVIDRVLRSAGLAPGRPEDHPAMLLMGRLDEPQDWYRWLGIPSTNQVLERLAELEPGQADCLAALTS